MKWQRDWMLHVRMAVTLGLFVVFAVVFLGTLTVLVVLGVSLVAMVTPVPEWTPVPLGGALTLVIVAGILRRHWNPGTPVAVRDMPVERVDRAEQPHLHDRVDRLAQQADLPSPAVAVADVAVPNAFTTGVSRTHATVVVTRGLLDGLSPEELTAVLAHELAHLKNRDAVVMTFVATPLVVAEVLTKWADDVTARKAGTGKEGLEMLALFGVYAVAGLFWLAGRALVRALSRSRELAADRGAVALTGAPAALASALRTISDTADVPREDLRSVHGATQAFAIVPADRGHGPVRLGPEGDRVPLTSRLMAPLDPYARRYLGTHPSTERRLALLGDLEAGLSDDVG